MAWNTFVAGNGINATKINENFTEVKNKANTNEGSLTTISNTALLKDGSNLTQTIIDTFQKDSPTVLSSQTGTVSLQDNKQYFMTLSGNVTISLPSITADQYSHTIILIVGGSNYSLTLGTTNSLSSITTLDTTKTYQVMYIYNKIDSQWYYCIGQ